MKIIRHTQELIRWRKSRPVRQKVGFVPTMGALHTGHLALVKRSINENDLTVVSIFVNPTQFGPKEDFSKYPRPWARDRALLAALNVDVAFYPPVKDMYPTGESTRVTVSGLTETLCGAPTSRGPGHFTGVATVVTKLFNVVRPDQAYFGLKDFQQVRVIEQLNRDLLLGVKIVRCPTIRERDGLALSSRNAYLSAAERRWAPGLHLALQEGRKLLTSHPRMNPQLVRRKMKTLLKTIPHSTLDYVELVNPETLKTIHSNSGPVLIAAAIKIGKTRLIDNILVHRS